MILANQNHIRCLCGARKPETVVPMQARAGLKTASCWPADLRLQYSKCDVMLCMSLCEAVVA